MEVYWYHDIIVVLLIVVLLQFMIIYNLQSNREICSIVPEFVSRPETSFIDTPAKVFQHSNAVQGIGGVAVTTFLGSPKWFQNRYTIMVNQMLSALPEDWVIQIFYQPNTKMAVEGTNYPGIQRQIARGKVILTPLPLDFKQMKKNEIMMTPFIWESAISENVLLFGGNAVLCANSPQNLTDYLHFDYIGSPWNEFNGDAGSNALNIRKRSIILKQIYKFHNDTMSTADSKREMVKEKKKKLAVREESYHAKEILSSKRYSVANRTDTYSFAMSGKIAIGTPLGAVGVLDGLSDKMRQQYLDYCPEMKMMFPSLHSPACFGAEPNVLECFKYLCNDGGLKCSKVNKSLKFLSKNDKEVTITIEGDSSVNSEAK